MSSLTVQSGLTRRSARASRSAVVARPRVPAPAARGGRTAVRLTRRGRVVVLALILLVMLAAMTALGSGSAATGEAGAPVQTRTVEVGEGDTLWAIASEVAAPGETREMVHRIQELNALSGAGVTIGQEIAVPVR